jgi:hypothetical protein
MAWCLNIGEYSCAKLLPYPVYESGLYYCNFICSCVSCLTSLINYEQVIYI